MDKEKKKQFDILKEELYQEYKNLDRYEVTKKTSKERTSILDNINKIYNKMYDLVDR